MQMQPMPSCGVCLSVRVRPSVTFMNSAEMNTVSSKVFHRRVTSPF